jgi:hypothetical protein
MSATPTTRRSAFDVRLIIALLMGLYGLVITIMGLGFTTDDEIDRAAGVNINLWAGIGMLAVAAAFLAWAMIRPLRIPEPDPEPADQQPEG